MQKIIYPLESISGAIFSSLSVIAQPTPNLLFIMADQYQGIGKMLPKQSGQFYKQLKTWLNQTHDPIANYLTTQ
ncbi:hypothetical protein AB9N12_04395 [Bacteroides sp. AN502(2024)]|uniref:hypothetical protein n=1 Tax=Bacteroides sp. AN502(2024) TaxID=3160599 RepID=UPI0035114F3B